MLEKYHALFIELQEEVNLAESEIKKAENILNGQFEADEIKGIVIPSMNEFRYVVRHVVDMLALVNDIDKYDEVKRNTDEAIDHCRRARFDALDAVVHVFIKKCADFKKEFKRCNITGFVPSYTEDCAELNKILYSSKYEESRTSKEGRGKYCTTKEQQVEILKNIINKWTAGEPMLRESISKEFYKMVGAIALFIFATIGAIGGILSILSFFKFC